MKILYCTTPAIPLGEEIAPQQLVQHWKNIKAPNPDCPNCIPNEFQYLALPLLRRTKIKKVGLITSGFSFELAKVHMNEEYWAMLNSEISTFYKHKSDPSRIDGTIRRFYNNRLRRAFYSFIEPNKQHYLSQLHTATQIQLASNLLSNLDSPLRIKTANAKKLNINALLDKKLRSQLEGIESYFAEHSQETVSEYKELPPKVAEKTSTSSAKVLPPSPLFINCVTQLSSDLDFKERQNKNTLISLSKCNKTHSIQLKAREKTTSFFNALASLYKNLSLNCPDFEPSKHLPYFIYQPVIEEDTFIPLSPPTIGLMHYDTSQWNKIIRCMFNKIHPMEMKFILFEIFQEDIVKLLHNSKSASHSDALNPIEAQRDASNQSVLQYKALYLIGLHHVTIYSSRLLRHIVGMLMNSKAEKSLIIINNIIETFSKQKPRTQFNEEEFSDFISTAISKRPCVMELYKATCTLQKTINHNTATYQNFCERKIMFAKSYFKGSEKIEETMVFPINHTCTSIQANTINTNDLSNILQHIQCLKHYKILIINFLTGAEIINLAYFSNPKIAKQSQDFFTFKVGITTVYKQRWIDIANIVNDTNIQNINSNLPLLTLALTALHSPSTDFTNLQTLKSMSYEQKKNIYKTFKIFKETRLFTEVLYLLGCIRCPCSLQQAYEVSLQLLSQKHKQKANNNLSISIRKAAEDLAILDTIDQILIKTMNIPPIELEEETLSNIVTLETIGSSLTSHSKNSHDSYSQAPQAPPKPKSPTHPISLSSFKQGVHLTPIHHPSCSKDAAPYNKDLSTNEAITLQPPAHQQSTQHFSATRLPNWTTVPINSPPPNPNEIMFSGSISTGDITLQPPTHQQNTRYSSASLANQTALPMSTSPFNPNETTFRRSISAGDITLQPPTHQQSAHYPSSNLANQVALPIPPPPLNPSETTFRRSISAGDITLQLPAYQQNVHQPSMSLPYWTELPMNEASYSQGEATFRRSMSTSSITPQVPAYQQRVQAPSTSLPYWTELPMNQASYSQDEATFKGSMPRNDTPNQPSNPPRPQPISSKLPNLTALLTGKPSCTKDKATLKRSMSRNDVPHQPPTHQQATPLTYSTLPNRSTLQMKSPEYTQDKEDHDIALDNSLKLICFDNKPSKFINNPTPNAQLNYEIMNATTQAPFPFPNRSITESSSFQDERASSHPPHPFEKPPENKKRKTPSNNEGNNSDIQAFINLYMN